jgi:hypothetical protein
MPRKRNHSNGHPRNARGTGLNAEKLLKELRELAAGKDGQDQAEEVAPSLAPSDSRG